MARARAQVDREIVGLDLEIQEEDPIRAPEYPLDLLHAIVARPTVLQSATGSQTLTVAIVWPTIKMF